MKPFPDKKYDVIYADPPWDVMGGPRWASNGLSRPLDYPTMKVDEIKAMPIKNIRANPCRLFMWTINKYLKEAFEIMGAWGFDYSTTLVWCKDPNGIGLGGTFSITTEFLLFGYCGKCQNKKRHDTTWWKAKRGRHSRKPDVFRDLIDETFDGDKIELFARPLTPMFPKMDGWDVWGDEVESVSGLCPDPKNDP